MELQLPKNEARIKALDGIRGVAILLVMFYHLFNFYPFSRFTAFGWVGVDLFFVLSGFLITSILLKSKKEKKPLSTFWRRRVLRILPLYSFVLMLIFVVAKTTSWPDLMYLYRIQGYFWTFTQNLFFAFKNLPGDNNMPGKTLNHFWSLAIEEQFYLFWPLVVLFLSRKYVVIIAIIFIILAVTLRNVYNVQPFYYVFTLARLDGLLIGSLFSLALLYHTLFLEKYVLLIFSFLMVFFIFFILHAYDLSLANTFMVKAGYTLIEVLFACIIVICFSKNKLGDLTRWLFQSQWLVFFGKYSYGLYVFHYMLYCFFETWLLNKTQLLVKNDTVCRIITGSGIIVLSVLVSYVSYHLFEKQFLKLKSLPVNNFYD